VERWLNEGGKDLLRRPASERRPGVLRKLWERVRARAHFAIVRFLTVGG
jgi:hypothetical protein